jgi:L-seryl-tRNA(Ser) seleniumtransferase
MPRNPYERFGVLEVVNAVGYATRVCGSSPHPEVLQAMAGAGEAFIEMDDLQRAASGLIARCTGAEAGIVTCGAGAALTLAAAACIVGNRPEFMDRLPEVSGCPRFEIIYPRPGPYDYDHPVRASGARLIEIDFSAPNALDAVQRAISPRTAALGYVWLGNTAVATLNQLVALGRRHDLPVLVDGALSLPPASNLQAIVSAGADLVAFSGGKHLGGPQASGILCGRASLIRSAWVQMVDMDVRPGTWSLQEWIDKGWIARPPRHGIGRSMKVGKEAVIGLMTALARYGERDHAAEAAAWEKRLDEIEAGLRPVSQVRVRRLAAGEGGQPLPAVVVESGEPPAGWSVSRLLLGLRRLPRKVLLAEDEQTPDRAYFYPMCLRPEDPAYIVAAVRALVAER